ncbi:methylated-DNA--[protein]-cysteine S-methyltransferase [Microbacterium ulmi]|uniref:Methylated-DNA--[protein]-cysteine S-methyltransferase n=1 Tax=Microbacterium ulmi TaxID=179095 RepID=A0A7Y2PY94_9MICO|nr:methylated-DNA--[protein]-cysteine S-methyltransferase [Microbacterium ulmi]NII68383.1 methylated-DNA-[protein]-cysteine S-methyltransferase [Microbacterium ulmi]NNH03086.1 methylated-DNA--[protein]-cysteine S-methyltransferase [Microbacterium ulmi]
MTHTAFRVHPSPVGDILIVATDEGIVTLHPFREPLGVELERLTHLLHAVPEHDETAGGDVDVQLDEYFAGERRTFDLQLDWRLVRGFNRAALDAVLGIPYGETAGYGEVAIAAGSPGAARAVGTACATTPFSIVVPVHRVVRADGSLGEYGGHPEVKRFLVDLEASAAARAAGE